MRLTDTLILVVVGGLVVYGALSGRGSRESGGGPREPGRDTAAPDTTPAYRDPRSHTPRPESRNPRLDLAPAARDARRDAPGTYFADMVADAKGQLLRWPDRREQGLRVW